MTERDRSHADQAPPARRSAPATPSPAGATLPAQVIALQRTAGNRAATRTLARWAAHPDKDKKGVLMSDEAADGYNRLNPPMSK
jgi:hypothetical protein